MKFEIVPAKIWHSGQIIRQLREEHRYAAAWLGINSHQEIRDRFDASLFAKSWLIDGKLAAMGGVCGSVLSDEGFVWLALTEEAARYRYAAAREARRQIAEIMVVKRNLFTTLIPEDRTALRFAMRLGFEVVSPTPIPVGNGSVIPVRYRIASKIAA